MLPYVRHLKKYSRRLRSKLTDAEQCLWRRLRHKQLEGVQFYRQKPLAIFIVDFYAPAANLVVEVDGSQHLSEPAMTADACRDAALAGMGLRVLRFDDRQVLCETNGVVEAIWLVLVERLERCR